MGPDASNRTFPLIISAIMQPTDQISTTFTKQTHTLDQIISIVYIKSRIICEIMIIPANTILPKIIENIEVSM